MTTRPEDKGNVPRGEEFPPAPIVNRGIGLPHAGYADYLPEGTPASLRRPPPTGPFPFEELRRTPSHQRTPARKRHDPSGCLHVPTRRLVRDYRSVNVDSRRDPLRDAKSPPAATSAKWAFPGGQSWASAARWSSASRLARA